MCEKSRTYSFLIKNETAIIQVYERVDIEMKKTLIILIGLILLAGGIYFGVSLTTNKKVDKEMEISTQFAEESNRFAQFANMDHTEKVVGELIGEGTNLVSNYSALTQERVDRLREINDILEETFADKENDVLKEFAELSTKLDTLAEADISKLTEEKQAEFEATVSEGKMIIMNRMAVSDAKVNQLKTVIEKLEALLP